MEHFWLEKLRVPARASDKKKGKEKRKAKLAFHNMSQSAAAGGEGGGSAGARRVGKRRWGAPGIVTTLVSYKVLINTL